MRKSAPPSPAKELLDHLGAFVEARAADPTPHRWLIAFSGGPDSTALLWGLSRLRAEHGLELTAAHLDHALDPGSADRARIAKGLAAELRIPFVSRRLGAADGLPVEAEAEPGHPISFENGPEAFARQRRYRYLETVADEIGASAILTAHHDDDQAETVLLRLLFGSGIEGLAGIALGRGRLLRPLLGLRRRTLEAAIAEAGLEPATDPTNTCLDRPRNRVRHRLLPRLVAEDPALVDRLVSLASTTRRSRDRLDARMRREAEIGLDSGVARADRRRLARLPGPLLARALSALDRSAGRPYPTPSAARRDLVRQLASDGPVGCDAGSGWRWQGDSRHLWLLAPEAPCEDFTYTLGIPGSARLEPLELDLRIRPGPVAEWMFEGHPDRVALALPGPDARIEVRNRRAGDRIQPLGRRSPKRLKDLLIDHGVPRHRRALLPLLIIDGEIAWVPGITIADRFRLDGQDRALIVELEETGRPPPPSGNHGHLPPSNN